MNNYDNLRNKKTSSVLGFVLSMLIVFEMCSLAVLFSRMSVWVDRESSTILPLTESTDMTKIKVGEMDDNGSIVFFEQMHAAGLPQINAVFLDSNEEQFVFTTSGTTDSEGSFIATDNETSASEGVTSNSETAKAPGFQVYDDDTVWSANTDVEIFKFSYVNGENTVTVAGNGSDKLIAPGTSNKYSFTLKNTGDVSLNYRLSMEAYITGTELSIPVEVRVYGHDGDYCLGGDDKWADVLDLNTVTKDGTLAADRYANYTLEWMWPFEGDDEYDTMLGNLATEGDVSLTVVIKTLAAQSEDPDDPGDNPPQTGDDTVSVVIWALVSLSLFIMIYMVGKKRSRRYYDE